MGWRSYLSVDKRDGTNVELDRMKDIVPSEWLTMFSAKDFRDDSIMENCINVRFEVSGSIALEKAKHYNNIDMLSDDLYVYIVEKVASEDVVVLHFGEVVDNSDYSIVISKEKYINHAEQFHVIYQSRTNS